jgi:hypothetical protein
MGCFDSFRPSEPIVCPSCHRATLREFQSKEFGENLQAFTVGDKVIFSDCLQLIDGKYPVHGHCRECSVRVDAEIQIEGGVLISIANLHAVTHVHP